MTSGIQDKYLKTILLFSVPFISLLITPWASAEPVNQSKMTFLVPTALALTGILFSNFRYLLTRFNKYFLVLIFMFLGQLILVLVLSPAPFNQPWLPAISCKKTLAV